jgi:hypothetical protein
MDVDRKALHQISAATADLLRAADAIIGSESPSRLDRIACLIGVITAMARGLSPAARAVLADSLRNAADDLKNDPGRLQ